MSVWDVYPAIDLRQGRVVRLVQGDPGRETSYGHDPVAVAQRWQAAGAGWVHVVNLDGALGEGGGENLSALARILARTQGLKVQFGGGLRDLGSVRRALDLGVSRVILGTAAVRDPALVARALDVFGAQRVAVGIDAQAGSVRTHGWREGTAIQALDLAQRWARRGMRWAIFTDVARDGMGRGLNLQATVRVADETGMNVIAAGGVAALADVRRAYEANLSGVVIGRALYEGDVKLEAALEIAAGHEATSC